MKRLRRGLIAVLLPLTVLAVLGAAITLWLDQQGARARLAEAQLEPALVRAQAAEARAVRAEASLTAIANERIAQAGATATAVSLANEPRAALERQLGRLFGVFQDPTGPGYDRLSEVFGQDALPSMRAEADFLRGQGRHLAGVSTFNIESAPVNRLADDRAEIHTTERWVYDERDASDRRSRCFVEDSDQTYTLRRGASDWIVDQVQLGSTRRTDCPPGT
jgi:hypothetical protein